MKRIKTIVIVLLLLLVTNFITASAILKLTGGNIQEQGKIKLLEKYIQKNYLREVTEEDFFEGQLKGTVEALDDPYSQYFTPEEMQQFVEVTSGKFYGIGVQVAPGEDNLITVIAPIKGSPADEVGIKSGDKIISVNGKDYMATDMEEAIKHIKGDKGTKVTLGILSKESATAEVKEVEVVRDEIKMESILSETLEGNIGYIGITQFEEATSEDFIKAAENLRSKGVKGIIIDMRGNPGGILDEAVAISDYLLPEVDIVSAKNRAGEEIFHEKSDKEYMDIPLVVLVNKASASASEIVSAALQDNKRAVLVGETTYGKGVVQTLIPLTGGAGLKLTTSEYFTPNGVNIDGKGIEPDYAVELPKDIQGIGITHLDQDVQLQKALELIKEN
ncbi:S41 family peptidase [Peptoniphilus sp. KCTC 25270]|uniref:S41 family peptidase n=1 Tax=Peptoniphilus sp. KCTC 25270 TaxID=2897414 RepID=UPI001E3E5666|nr:S41 family peptidase [Peptoniphilus sp. KCTC 25270]MCD1146799.1 S41 family peptidase [Peptoniphilus sp. KCTC 25270]